MSATTQTPTPTFTRDDYGCATHEHEPKILTQNIKMYPCAYDGPNPDYRVVCVKVDVAKDRITEWALGLMTSATKIKWEHDYDIMWVEDYRMVLKRNVAGDRWVELQLIIHKKNINNWIKFFHKVLDYDFKVSPFKKDLSPEEMRLVLDMTRLAMREKEARDAVAIRALARRRVFRVIPPRYDELPPQYEE